MSRIWEPAIECGFPRSSPHQLGDVRRAIGEAIQISRSDNLSKRTQLHDMLDNDERRAKIEQALIEQDPRMWAEVRTTTADGEAAKREADRETDDPPRVAP